jgi:hypothetical protein
MNTKEMIASIVTAMLVMAMFTSSAMAINVDGLVSPSNEWDGDWSANDNPSGDPCDVEDHGMGDWGYNMKTVYQHYDRLSNTLYFRLDVCGMPADLNGDNDVNGPCAPTDPPCDCGGVGAYEQYELKLVSNGYPGINMRYASNNVAHSDANAQWGADCIEFSLTKADTYVNPYDYCMMLSAGGIADPPYSEDLMDACYSNDPPEAKFDFTTVCCESGKLDATASTDDGQIVSYEWDFNNDSVCDKTGAIVSPYTIGGDNYVCLTVTDNLGQSNTLCQWVLMTGCPVAVAKANGNEGPTIQLPEGGEMVVFSGTDSYHPDDPVAWIESCVWVIGGKTSDQCTVPLFIDQETTAELTVTDNFGCTDTDTLRLIVPPPHETSEVPILTPTGMVALIGMLCIVGAGRILTKGRRL